jgi:hypothetical protein
MDLGSFPPPLHRITPAEKSSTTHRQGERKCQFPFERDIKPLFRQIDIEHMNKHKVLLDNFAYMADPSNDHGNAQAVEDSLTNQSMPPGGPYWSSEELTLYRQWKSDGYLP